MQSMRRSCEKCLEKYLIYALSLHAYIIIMHAIFGTVLIKDIDIVFSLQRILTPYIALS